MLACGLLVGALKRLADGVEVEGLEAAELDDVHVIAVGLHACVVTLIPESSGLWGKFAQRKRKKSRRAEMDTRRMFWFKADILVHVMQYVFVSGMRTCLQ
jgi:hypothetical protein